MKTIRCVIVEPDKAPYISSIPNTLEAKQEIVNGLIDYLIFDSDAEIVFNEEFLDLMLPINRVLFDKRTFSCVVLRGTFIIVGAADEEGSWTSLSKSEAEKYIKLFSDFQIPWNSDYCPLNHIDSYRKWFHRN
ncbi:MAG: DUF3846 domain-containing protein [Ruminococcaceae bacterium]|nr:DUF3846 domain-containing protein [Oscillospiraceae bacterium]